MKINWTTIGLTFAGGALGTLFRIGADYGINQLVGTSLGELLGLLVVNTLGAGVIGWLNGDPRMTSNGRRAFWGVGFAGGFTTMSGIALFLLLSAGFDPIAIAIAVGMFGLGFVAYWASHTLTSRLTGNFQAVSHDVEEISE